MKWSWIHGAWTGYCPRGRQFCSWKMCSSSRSNSTPRPRLSTLKRGGLSWWQARIPSTTPPRGRQASFIAPPMFGTYQGHNWFHGYILDSGWEWVIYVTVGWSDEEDATAGNGDYDNEYEFNDYKLHEKVTLFEK